MFERRAARSGARLVTRPSLPRLLRSAPLRARLVRALPSWGIAISASSARPDSEYVFAYLSSVHVSTTDAYRPRAREYLLLE